MEYLGRNRNRRYFSVSTFIQFILTLLLLCKANSEISTGNNQFGLKLYTSLAEKVEGDFIISPFPLSALIAQLYGGSEGATKTEIRDFLQFSDDAIEVSKDYSRVINDLQSVESLEEIAYQLFINTTSNVSEDFTELLNLHFNTLPVIVNVSLKSEVVEEVAQWIALHDNNGTATDEAVFITEDQLASETSILLGTRSRFKGSWVHQFNPENTKPSPFFYNENKSNQVEMMFERLNIPYAEIEDLDCTSVAIPYKTLAEDPDVNSTYSSVSLEDHDTETLNTRIELIILLPNSRTGLKELEQKLKSYPFSQITRRFFETKDLFLYMPKFHVKSSHDVPLGFALSQLGFTSAFDYKTADFSKMFDSTNVTERLWISNIFQSAELSVDELGSNGKAAPKYSTKNHHSPMSFRVNRPFIGFIYDQERHIILNIFRKTG